jgi:cell division protein FtsB
MDKVTYRPKNLPEREVKNTRVGNLFNNLFVKVLLLGVSAFLCYNVAHSIEITDQKVSILKNAREEVEQLRVTNLNLETQLDNMRSSDYIEIAARDKLNLSGSNETTFVIPDSLMASAKESLDVILNGQKNTPSRSVPQQWEELILNGV